MIDVDFTAMRRIQMVCERLAAKGYTNLVVKHMNEMCEEHGWNIVNIMQGNAPQFMGNLKSSLMVEVGEMEARIFDGSKHGQFVEFGTRPHMPNVEAITPWAKAHGIPPWALAKKIERDGTPARPFFFPSVDTYFKSSLFKRTTSQNLKKLTQDAIAVTSGGSINQA